jgi:ABC-type multidrug transport system ATPase subunit
MKKIGIIATLIGKPEVVILDEPFANLDPTTQFRLKKSLKIWQMIPKLRFWFLVMIYFIQWKLAIE